MQKFQIFKDPKYHKEVFVGKVSTEKLKTTLGLRNLFCFPLAHLKKVAHCATKIICIPSTAGAMAGW